MLSVAVHAQEWGGFENRTESDLFKVNSEQWHRLYREHTLGKHYSEAQSYKNTNTNYNPLFSKQKNKTTIREEEEWYEPDTVMMFNPYWERRDLITYNEHGFKNMTIYQDMWYGMHTELQTYAREIYTYNADNRILSLTGQIFLTNETWSNYNLFTYTYDANGNETSFLLQYWNGQSWVNDHRRVAHYDNRSNLLSRYLQFWDENNWVYESNHYTFTYDAHNNKLSELTQYWNGTQLQNYELATYTYNEKNYNDTIIHQVWNSNENIWNNYDMYLYMRDNHGNITNGLRKTWINDEWINYRGTVYTYDTNDNLLSLMLLLWQNDAWINDRQYIYSYDFNNNMLSKSELLFDKTNNKWMNWERFLYTYNEAHCLSSSTWQEGSGEAWVNRDRLLNEYDHENNKISTLVQLWKNNTWEDYSLYEYKYDEHGNCLSGDLWEWKNDTWVAAYAFELEITYNHKQSIIGGEYYCHTISASYIKTPKPIIAIEEIEKAEVVVYPNPTTGELKVESGKLKVERVEVFDVYGKRHASRVTCNEMTIDISDLQVGIYFIKITTDKGIVTKKIIKY